MKASRNKSGNPPLVRVGILVLALLLAGMPLQAQDGSQPPTSAPPQNPSSAPATQLPDAPRAQTDSQKPQAETQDQQPATAPAGAAAARTANEKGTPAAQPLGAAIAPPKQHQRRSLLIKVGLIAGAGIAVGTVLALSKASPNRPSGAQAAVAHQ